jgi:hypothetical protein
MNAKTEGKNEYYMSPIQTISNNQEIATNSMNFSSIFQEHVYE